MSAPTAAPLHRHPPTAASRNVILHYHLFKNAGTSLDHALKAHFKAAWYEQEGEAGFWPAAAVGEFIAGHPDLVVLSSHTALLPLPVVPGTIIHPLLFLRHPLDRIRSVYDFERKQAADTEGSLAARATDLRGYITWRMSRKGDRAIRDFQTYRLAMALPPGAGDEAARARQALDLLPHVGVVERFARSLAGFEEALAPVFPGLVLKPVQANVTQRVGLSMDDRLAGLRAEVGEVLYEQLEQANEADLALHRLALARYQE